MQYTYGPFFFLFFSTIFFVISFYGVLTNKRNLIMVLLFIELSLLASNFNFLIFSIFFNNIIGSVSAIFILLIAGAGVSIGLAFVILVFRMRGVLNLNLFIYIKG